MQRFITIDEEGNVKARGNEKIAYAGLMKTRAYIIISAYSTLFKSLTIATRYSFLRTQFKDENKDEIPIFDYQLQKEKILTQISRAYAMASSFRAVRELVGENEKRAENDDFSLLQTCHISLSGYKALFSQWDIDGVSALIQACGGHGYSSFAGMDYLFKRFYPDTIYEGENSVMLLQVARGLLKAAQRIQGGDIEMVQPDMKYIGDNEILNFVLSEELGGNSGLKNCADLVRVFKKTAVFHVRATAEKLLTHVMEGVNPLTVSHYLITT